MCFFLPYNNEDQPYIYVCVCVCVCVCVYPSFLCLPPSYLHPTTPHPFPDNWASLVAQRLKSLSRMQETRVRSLGWEDPLEEEMASHSSTLAWRVPWTEEPGGLWSMGSQRVGHG